MRLIFEWEGVEVWGEDITLQEGETMRSAERRVAAEMAVAIFGPGDKIIHDPSGAPGLASGEASISVSHGAGMLVLAVDSSGRHVGVDIESPRPQLQRVVRRFVCASDSAGLSLLQLWTAKEAAFKAACVPGLVISEIPVTGSSAAPVAWLPDGRNMTVHYHELASGALIALAISADGLPAENKS